MLEDFIARNREEIIKRCRAKAMTRSGPRAITADNDHGVPMFLDQLVGALQPGRTSNPEIGRSATRHGHNLLLQGVTVSQVVHDYGDVCQSVTELALETRAAITVEEFHTLNQCLDDAIAGAVTEYDRERHNQSHDGETAPGNERHGFFTHELGNLINTGIIAFEILKTGNVGVGGSTGAVLRRSLMGLRALVTRSMAEIRFTEGIQNREAFLMTDFIDEIGPGMTLEAASRGLKLVLAGVEDGVLIMADRQVIAAVVVNLLQNAFKFTGASTIVTLRVGASAERVLIEVEDECGGLPVANVNSLFRPFEQRGADRTGVGLGLAFCRWAVDAHGGRIYARNIPETGCVFTVDLPRYSAAAAAIA
jgi:signal transduction histidine kinase